MNEKLQPPAPAGDKPTDAIEAEQAIIGAAAYVGADGLAIIDKAKIAPGDYANPDTGKALSLIRGMVDDGKDCADALAVSTEAQEKHGKAEGRRLAAFIRSCYDAIPSEPTARANLPLHLKAVKRAAKRRRLAESADAMKAAALSGDTDGAAAIAAAAGEPEADEPAPPPSEEVNPFPRSLLSCDGVINDFAEHANLSAEHPNPVCNFFAGVAFVSAMAGRRYIGTMGNSRVYPREYIIMLAQSSAGKDQGRKLMGALFSDAQAPGLIHSAGSGEGIEDELIEANGGAILLSDEVHNLINAIALEQTERGVGRMGEILLNLYTSAGGGYKRRALSKRGQKKKGDGEDEPAPYIVNPSLTWYGCSIPDEFYAACNERLFRNGLIGRCLVIEGDKRSPYRPPAQALAVLPRSLRDFVAHCMGRPPDAPLCAGVEATALSRYEAVQVAADEEYDKATSEAERALWGRMAEHAGTLALLAAISRDYLAPTVTPDCVEWGVAVASWAIRRTLARYADKETPLTVGRAQFIADIERVSRALPPKGKRIEHSRLLKRCKLPAHSFRLAIDTLIERREVEVCQVGKERQQPAIYRRL